MASTVAGAKYCCKCGSDVSATKRMKDSGGRYWCLPCGQTDQKKKAASTGVSCASCGEQFPMSQLTQSGGAQYCAKCMKSQNKSSGGGLAALFDIKRYLPDSSGGDEDDGGRKKKNLIMLVLLVVAIVAANYFLH